MRPFLTNWLSISRLINGKDAADGNILKYNGTEKRFEPSFQAAVLYTTVGGAAAEVVTITGAAVGDSVVVTLATAGATPRTIASAIVTDDDEVTITFSGDPDDDHVVNILVTRP